jgi:hypothetical protein
MSMNRFTCSGSLVLRGRCGLRGMRDPSMPASFGKLTPYPLRITSVPNPSESSCQLHPSPSVAKHSRIIRELYIKNIGRRLVTLNFKTTAYIEYSARIYYGSRAALQGHTSYCVTPNVGFSAETSPLNVFNFKNMAVICNDEWKTKRICGVGG